MNKRHSVQKLPTSYAQNGLETKTLFKIGLELKTIVNTSIPVGPASLLSFIKQNDLPKLKQSYPALITFPIGFGVNSVLWFHFQHHQQTGKNYRHDSNQNVDL